jgi:hypothetical protein
VPLAPREALCPTASTKRARMEAARPGSPGAALDHVPRRSVVQRRSGSPADATLPPPPRPPSPHPMAKLQTTRPRACMVPPAALLLCALLMAAPHGAGAARPQQAQPRLADGAAGAPGGRAARVGRGLYQAAADAGGARCGGPCLSDANPGGCPCDSSCACLDQAVAAAIAAGAGTGEPPPLLRPVAVAQRRGGSRARGLALRHARPD